MTEFEKAKKKYEKRKAKESNVVPIKKEPPIRHEIHVSVVDGANTYNFTFSVPNLPGTRIASKRNQLAYEEAFGELIHKEFGKWQLIHR